MATDPLQHFRQQAIEWARKARLAGWLPEEAVTRLESVETSTPGQLFDTGEQRPLVVAFFGGTGVGKSSLLNRLAGEAIARTGVERPTSREVTLYLHETVQVRSLPAAFPVEKVKIALHRKEENRNILWIDMPDIDSVDTRNRELVLDWLPHIDLLIYVVSPERYRDDRGWRLLLEHGHRHAWLFVINQWDKGDPAQREDFVHLLKEAGFDEPMVFCTDSRGESETEDDFPRLADTIRTLASAHTIRQLEIRGITVRMEELREALRQAAERLGPEEGFPALENRWQTLWKETAEELQQGLEWKMEELADRFAARENGRGWFRHRREPEPETENPEPGHVEIWDPWARTRLEDALDALVIEADALSLPTAPLRKALSPLPDSAAKEVENHLQRSLRAALRKPGTAWQRLLYRITGLLAALLPLLAIAWVGYRVLVGYYQSATAPEHYLGIDFAIHSVLLVITAWLLPYLIHRRVKPSLQKAALRGLRTGLDAGLESISRRLLQSLEELHKEQETLRREYERLLQEQADREPAPLSSDDETLLRMLRRTSATERKRTE